MPRRPPTSRSPRGPRAATLAVAALSSLIASRAWAAPMISAGPVTRDVMSHADPITVNWINRSDCLANDVLHVPLIIQDGLGLQVEGWVGQGSNDCTQVI